MGYVQAFVTHLKRRFLKIPVEYMMSGLPLSWRIRPCEGGVGVKRNGKKGTGG